MTTLKNQISELTNSQKELFDSLVRLGDSKDLALKTVLDKRRFNPETKETSSMYEFAYLK